jgi:H+-transporting ATPase
MYLKLSVAGHLTIFLTRTRGPFWSIRPAKVLWIAVLGTQAIATLIAVYGLFMAPLGWRMAGMVWGYALVWFLINDRIKLMTYWILDRSKSQAKSNVKAVDGKTESPVGTEAAIVSGVAAKANPEAQPDVESASAPMAKAEGKPDATIAQASDAKARTTSETKATPEAKADQKADATAAPVIEAKARAKPETKAAAGPPEGAADTKPDAKGAAVRQVESKPSSDLTPKLVERVHALYEELGRQDVLAVQELEQSEKTKKEEAVP